MFMKRLFNLFKGLFHLMLLLTFMSMFTACVATLFWVFRELDGTTVIHIFCWAGSFFITGLFFAGLAYMTYRDDEHEDTSEKEDIQ